MDIDKLKARLKALKSEKIFTVARLEESRDEALRLAAVAISELEKANEPAPDFAFFGDEGIK